MAQGVRCLYFDPVGTHLIPPQWWTFRHKHSFSTGVNSLGGESIGWTIRKVVHPTGSNRLVDNPQVEKSTMIRIFLSCSYLSMSLLQVNNLENGKWEYFTKFSYKAALWRSIFRKIKDIVSFYLHFPLLLIFLYIKTILTIRI